MHPDIHLAVYRVRAAELEDHAAAHRRAAAVRRTPELRVRLGWTLVAFGLRLVTAPRAAAVS
ncbi:hypothetical protein [Streptomyces sp. DH24]|uniref:hypothetical protein n=1 Tax=Streptomyces sp. DH24 TaxID=3040123 RepID=UPI0024427D68|nr:hypothetical protein [Streptomyces sp. DH24]MDG9720346.1 hypothetical protein [Streptomyces sp. DH24]